MYEVNEAAVAAAAAHVCMLTSHRRCRLRRRPISPPPLPSPPPPIQLQQVNLPETGPLKPSIFNGLMPVLEEWAGVKLTPTSCYGIRAYTQGSWLANHVDTRSTHAISGIIQVDQVSCLHSHLYDHILGSMFLGSL
jgi:hypothetical protein